MGALGRAGAVFTRPWLDLDADAARRRVDPHGHLGEIAGRSVLCLAGGGGQQSAAFALLGARVWVLDIDEGQLERDRLAAQHHRVSVETEQGDMRDLSRWDEGAFDVVYHPYSLNFVPDLQLVVGEVARVLRVGGIYTMALANPFAAGVGTGDWTGAGYELRLPYLDGLQYRYDDEEWVGASPQTPAPREFRHTLGTVVTTFSERGLVLFHLDEHTAPPGAPPGTWDHLRSVVPPWLTLWARRTG